MAGESALINADLEDLIAQLNIIAKTKRTGFAGSSI